MIKVWKKNSMFAVARHGGADVKFRRQRRLSHDL